MWRIWLFLIKNIKKLFAVCNYILQFHYKAHFNSSPNRFYQSSCHFLFRKVIKSGLEIIPFSPVSRILICFIGISLSFPFECSPYLHNLHCRPLPGDNHRLGFSSEFYRVTLHFGLFSFSRTRCLPWPRTADGEQDAGVLCPSLPSWPSASTKTRPVSTGHELTLEQPHFPSAKWVSVHQLHSVKTSEYLCAAWKILRAF